MATTTITTTAAHDARVAPAIGALLGLTVPGTNNLRNVTAAEVKAHLVAYLTNIVREYEARQAAAAIVPAAPITPT